MRVTHTVKYEFETETKSFGGPVRVFKPVRASIEALPKELDFYPPIIFVAADSNPHDVELSITYTTGK